MDLLTGRLLDGTEDESSIENEELWELKEKARKIIEKKEKEKIRQSIDSLN